MSNRSDLGGTVPKELGLSRLNRNGWTLLFYEVLFHTFPVIANFDLQQQQQQQQQQQFINTRKLNGDITK